MRFKKDIIVAKSNLGNVYIIPTDDSRLKFVITPVHKSGDMIAHVKECLA
jgi:hypothetical protein